MYYKTATPEELREEYWRLRNALANQGNLARSVTSHSALGMLGRQTGRSLEQFDLLCNVARMRGIDLLAPVVESRTV